MLIRFAGWIGFIAGALLFVDAVWELADDSAGFHWTFVITAGAATLFYGVLARFGAQLRASQSSRVAWGLFAFGMVFAAAGGGGAGFILFFVPLLLLLWNAILTSMGRTDLAEGRDP